jgi:hypothetical protein
VSRCSELSYGNRAMVDQRVAPEKQNGVGTPYIPPMTRRLKCRIDPEQSPYGGFAFWLRIIIVLLRHYTHRCSS